MRLLSFDAVGVHGFQDHHIEFDNELTFITGINGSGKTTVLNLVASLLSPSLFTLASVEFRSCVVRVLHRGQKITIRAQKDDRFIALSAPNDENSFRFQIYTSDFDGPTARQVDLEMEYYREFLIRNSDHPVFQAIANLPTPMFLGLDRRARFAEETPGTRALTLPRASRLSRNLFGASLSGSTATAIALADTTYRTALIAAGRVSEKLKNDLVINLLDFSQATSSFGQVSLPSDQELIMLASMRKSMKILPEILGLPSQEVDKKLLPLLDALEGAVSKIPSSTNVQSILGGSGRKNTEAMNGLLFWMTNKSSLSKLAQLAAVTNQYNSERQSLLQKFESYLTAVNAFLRDSGKTVRFSEEGYISFSLAGDERDRDIANVSSGEAQVFTILTHLFFHPLAQQENLFIVDEPELSLHVQWQELFVESIRRANPQVQYVLATHSPSMILDKISNCRDISPKRASS